MWPELSAEQRPTPLAALLAGPRSLLPPIVSIIQIATVALLCVVLMMLGVIFVPPRVNFSALELLWRGSKLTFPPHASPLTSASFPTT